MFSLSLLIMHMSKEDDSLKQKIHRISVYDQYDNALAYDDPARM